MVLNISHLQLMEPGIHGAHGAAAVRPVVGASSRGRESVRGLSLEEKPARVKQGSRSAAMTKDVQVSGSNATHKRGLVKSTASV